MYLAARKWEKGYASAGAGVEPIGKILSWQESGGGSQEQIGRNF